jgi:hypothetical protein
MKKLLSLIVVCLLAITAYSQAKTKKGKAVARSSSSTPVDVAQVPQPVQDTHNQTFPGTTLTRWESRKGSGKKEIQWYSAVFTTPESTKARARYKADGVLVSSSTHYDAAKAPEAVKSAAASRFSDYTLLGCEKINLPAKNKDFYRVRLKKGSTKVTTYMDETGAEITKEKAPAEILESDEGEEG